MRRADGNIGNCPMGTGRGRHFRLGLLGLLHRLTSGPKNGPPVRALALPACIDIVKVGRLHLPHRVVDALQARGPDRAHLGTQSHTEKLRVDQLDDQRPKTTHIRLRPREMPPQAVEGKRIGERRDQLP